MLIIPSPGAAQPTLGTCLVSYRFFDNPTSGVADGLYDLCRHQKLELWSKQEVWPDGKGYAILQLSGDRGIMNVYDVHHVIPPTIAIFAFSMTHPLYDFYH